MSGDGGVVVAVSVLAEEIARVTGRRPGVDDQPFTESVDADLTGVVIAVPFGAVSGLGVDDRRRRPWIPIGAAADVGAVGVVGPPQRHSGVLWLELGVVPQEFPGVGRGVVRVGVF